MLHQRSNRGMHFLSSPLLGSQSSPVRCFLKEICKRQITKELYDPWDELHRDDVLTLLPVYYAEQFIQEPPEVQARVRGIVQGDIRDLSAFPDGAFVATLCLGCPLAHLHDDGERRHAMGELAKSRSP
mgnify:CR=1 FL=1